MRERLEIGVLDYHLNPYMTAVLVGDPDPIAFARACEMNLPLSQNAKIGAPMGELLYDFNEFVAKVRIINVQLAGRVIIFPEALAVTDSVAGHIAADQSNGMSSVFWTTQIESMAKTDGEICLQHEIQPQHKGPLNAALRDVFGTVRVLRDCFNNNSAISIRLLRL